MEVHFEPLGHEDALPHDPPNPRLKEPVARDPRYRAALDALAAEWSEIGERLSTESLEWELSRSNIAKRHKAGIRREYHGHWRTDEDESPRLAWLKETHPARIQRLRELALDEATLRLWDSEREGFGWLAYEARRALKLGWRAGELLDEIIETLRGGPEALTAWEVPA